MNYSVRMLFSLRHFVLICSLLLFFCSVLSWLYYDPSQVVFQRIVSMKFSEFYFHFGIDGISLFFIYLTSFLIPLCILFGWNKQSLHNHEYIVSILCIEILLVLVFSVLDIFLFYIFFESILIPFFIMIGIKGTRSRKIHASYLLFFYTLFGSLLMLVAIFSSYIHTGTTDFQILWGVEYSTFREYLLWLCFFISLSIKVPIFPFHIWLPEAHVEAPTEASVILAGVLLKVGTYGFLRILIPMFPSATLYFNPVVLLMCSIAIFYTSMTTLRQVDIKRIVAYSSISHMNFSVIGLLLLDPVSTGGSLILMLGHGVVSGGLFFMIGILYEKHKTKIIKYYSGLVNFMPIFSVLLFVLIISNMSMPGTSNFIGELSILCGVYNQANTFIILILSLGIFVSTVYTIWIYNKIIFGIPNADVHKKFSDVTYLQFIIMIPIILAVLWIGLFPKPFLESITNSIYYINQYYPHVLTEDDHNVSYSLASLFFVRRNCNTAHSVALRTIQLPFIRAYFINMEVFNIIMSSPYLITEDQIQVLVDIINITIGLSIGVLVYILLHYIDPLEENKEDVKKTGSNEGKQDSESTEDDDSSGKSNGIIGDNGPDSDSSSQDQ